MSMLVVLCELPVNTLNLLIVVTLDLSGIVMATDAQQHQNLIIKTEPSSSSLRWLLDNLKVSTETAQPQDHHSASCLCSSQKTVAVPNVLFKKNT